MPHQILSESICVAFFVPVAASRPIASAVTESENVKRRLKYYSFLKVLIEKNDIY